MEKRKFLVDCDTGSDDAIAIAAALCEQSVEVVAFCAVDGNVEIEYTSKNTLDVVDFIGSKIPVAVGAHEALKMRFNYHELWQDCYGRMGMGNVEIPDASRPFSETDGVQMIYEKAKECGGELEILAIGPLTDIALCIMLHPEVKGLIKHIWIMGGSILGGNVSSCAEFNFWADPEAARIVYKSGIPLTMCGLDVTTKAIISREDAEFFKKIDTKAGILVSKVLDYMFWRNETLGGEDAMMHDALAFAAAVCPQCLTFKDAYVDIECEGTLTYGHSAVDFKVGGDKKPNCRVATELGLPVFVQWLKDTIASSKLQDIA